MFYSILFKNQEKYEQTRQTDEPDCFKDLHLDQIFAPLLKSKKEFELEGFFFSSLHDAESVTYRQEVMCELENDELRRLFTVFSKTIHDLDRYMVSIRASLTSDSSYDNNYLTRGRMLDCAERYCAEISALAAALKGKILRSEGLRAFAEYLSAYSMSETFKGLCTHVVRLRKEFSTVEYCMLIKNGTIRVRKYEGQPDHSKQILACFEKFRQSEVKDYRQKVMEEPAAAHVEAAVLKMVAGLYKDIFDDLNSFCKKYLYFLDATITRFAREVQFYLSWLDYILPLRQAGLPFNYPKLCDTAEHLFVLNGFDLALAFVKRDKTVTNDFMLSARLLLLQAPIRGGRLHSHAPSGRYTGWHLLDYAFREAKRRCIYLTKSSHILAERRICQHRTENCRTIL